MANRHTHKKLRAEIRARMRATGESYQKARARILSSGVRERPRADLVPISYFGLPATLATIESQGVVVCAVVPSSTLWGHRYPHPFPLPLLRGLLRPRGIQ
jgi:hypothetical protein